MSTLAIDPSDRAARPGRLATGARYADVALLVLALPVFLVGGLPMLGYGVLAGAWLAQLALEIAAERRAARALAAGERRVAMGLIAGATLGRVWIVTLSILLVGLAEREAGLAAAVLAAVLVTSHLTGRFIGGMLVPEERE